MNVMSEFDNLTSLMSLHYVYEQLKTNNPNFSPFLSIPI